eukprot:1179133-Prorocentrum_minimum.AAC.4
MALAMCASTLICPSTPDVSKRNDRSLSSRGCVAAVGRGLACSARGTHAHARVTLGATRCARAMQEGSEKSSGLARRDILLGFAGVAAVTMPPASAHAVRAQNPLASFTRRNALRTYTKIEEQHGYVPPKLGCIKRKFLTLYAPISLLTNIAKVTL